MLVYVDCMQGTLGDKEWGMRMEMREEGEGVGGILRRGIGNKGGWMEEGDKR